MALADDREGGRTDDREGRRAGDSLAWCLSPRTAAPARAIAATDVAVAEDVLLGGWQLLPVTLPRIARWAGVGAGTEAADGVADLLERARCRLVADDVTYDVQMRLLSRLAGALGRRGVGFVLLKSAAMRLVAYDEPGQRHARDIDLAVAPEDLPQAIEAVAECGFVQAQWREDRQCFESADPALRTQVESEHYELGFWVRVQEVADLDADQRAAILAQRHERPAQWEIVPDEPLATYIVVDVHHALSLDIPVVDMIATARTATLDGVDLPVPRGDWLLFHLVYKLYVEGAFAYREGAYQYADLCRLLPRLDDEDVARFVGRIEDYHLRAAAYYVLRRLPDLFGVALPAPLAAALADWSVPDPASSPARQNDWGDMWPKLWGMR